MWFSPRTPPAAPPLINIIGWNYEQIIGWREAAFDMGQCANSTGQKQSSKRPNPNNFLYFTRKKKKKKQKPKERRKKKKERRSSWHRTLDPARSAALWLCWWFHFLFTCPPTPSWSPSLSSSRPILQSRREDNLQGEWRKNSTLMCNPRSWSGRLSHFAEVRNLPCIACVWGS